MCCFCSLASACAIPLFLDSCIAVLQEVWEAQAAIVERSANAAADKSTDEQASFEDEASRRQDAYQAQLERLMAADVVLVPYGVLSQEVSLQAHSATYSESAL